MSFVQTPAISGKAYAPGWFLADAENCERRTKTIAATGAADGENGGKYVPMGTIYPSNDANAIGIVYEDVDVTTGDMPGSVVLSGTVYEDRLADTVSENAKTALTALGFKFIAEAPAVSRPY